MNGNAINILNIFKSIKHLHTPVPLLSNASPILLETPSRLSLHEKMKI